MMRTILALFTGLALAVSGVVALAVILWRLWSKGPEARESRRVEIELPGPRPEAVPETASMSPARTEEGNEAATQVAHRPPAPVEADDLKIIEGIGPRIASVLREAGIGTFAQLADTEVHRIDEILREADPRLARLADPGTWPEQASLAASGDTEALATLQDRLKGGRRRG